MNLWTIISFNYSQTLSAKTAVKGQTLTLRIGIYNDKPYPFTMMKINVDTGKFAPPVTLRFNLESQSHIEFDIPVDCRYRGMYELGMTSIEMWDMFGLFPMTFILKKQSYYRPLSLLVYPNIDIIGRLPAYSDDAKQFSQMRLKASEEGESFSDARQYKAGDSSKRIHWKLSARKRELFTKQYEVPLETHSLVLIDNREPGLEGEDAYAFADLVCECAASIIRYCLQRGYPVKAVECGEKRPAMNGVSVADFDAIYDWLAILPFDAPNQLSDVFELEAVRRNDVGLAYVITSRPSEELNSQFEVFRAKGGSVVCLSVQIPGVRMVAVSSGKDIETFLGEAI
jgi:hypothetical protein